MSKQVPASTRQFFTLNFPRSAFLRAIGAIYAAAFASIATQIRGLYGEDGLEPVDVFLHRLQQRDEQLRVAPPVSKMAIYPTAVWFHEALQWSPSFMMQVIALAGLTISLLILCDAKWRTTLPLAFVWFGYLSIVQCGQTFMQFQWDSFLLEVGFLAIWIAPWWSTESDVFETPLSIVWTLRFLFYKFMLMSGAVKIQSRCPTWLGLTALEYHFATQPLPLPLGWYAHQLPPIFLRLGVAATLLFEGPWTFFILAPLRPLRQFSVVMQILLQVMIMLTGNYNFFNLLTVVMAMTLLDIRSYTTIDTEPKSAPHTAGSIARLVRKTDRQWQSLQQHLRTMILALLGAIGYCLYTFLDVFAVGYDSSLLRQNSWEPFILSIWIKFTPSVEEVQAWIAEILPASIAFSAGLIAAASVWQLLMVWSSLRSSTRHHGSRCLKSMYILSSSMIAALVFCSSALTLSILDRPFQQSMPLFMLETYGATSHWRITSAYGLFRTMTGVGSVQHNGQPHPVVARPEIILEGTSDNGVTWKEFHFLYKPGDVDRGPRVNVPFQPRLDWQMWFAALGSYQSAPWIVHLVDKLLRGSPEVKALLDSSRDPFPLHPPHAIRAQLYYYDFTRLNTTWHRTLPMVAIVNDTSEAAWWSRTLDGEYLPALEQGNPTVAKFVQHHFGRETIAPTPHPMGCDASSSSSSPLPSLVRAWSCHTLQYLVTWPVTSALMLSSSLLLLVRRSSVPMSHLTTQTPKQKME